MEIITWRDLVRQVAERWKNRYADYKFADVEEKRAIGKRLAALNLETAHYKTVNQIIGNDSWTTEMCAECRKPKRRLILLGVYDVQPICRDCIIKAAKLLKIKT